MRISGYQYRNKNNKDGFNQDQKKLAKHRRRLLEEAQARQKNEKKEASKVEVRQTAPSVEHELKILKRNFAKLQTETNKLKKDRAVSRKEIRELKSQNHELRLKIKQDNNEFRKQEADFDEQMRIKDAEVARAKQLRKWFAKKKLDESGSVRQYIDQVSLQNELLASLFIAIKTQNQNIYQDWRAKTKEVDKSAREADKYKKQKQDADLKLGRLRKQLKVEQEKRREVTERSQHQIRFQAATPQMLLNRLIKECKPENVGDYNNLDALVEKYQITLDQLLSQQYTSEQRYGYIEFNDDQYLLHDVNHNETYPVKVPLQIRSNTRFHDGLAVRCHRNSQDLNEWEVDRFYATISHTIGRQRKIYKRKKFTNVNGIKNSREIILTNPAELVWTKKLRVLVVGNKYSSGFLDELKKYCHVQVLDGYEDGEQQIFRAMHTADYVFLLIGSVPHTITMYTKRTEELKEGSEKVQIFDTPAKYDGVIRLHYLYAINNRK